MPSFFGITNSLLVNWPICELASTTAPWSVATEFMLILLVVSCWSVPWSVLVQSGRGSVVLSGNPSPPPISRDLMWFLSKLEHKIWSSLWELMLSASSAGSVGISGWLWELGGLLVVWLLLRMLLSPAVVLRPWTKNTRGLPVYPDGSISWGWEVELSLLLVLCPAQYVSRFYPGSLVQIADSVGQDIPLALGISDPSWS